MIVRFGVDVRIDTDKLTPEMRSAAASEAESQGFPPNEENVAWFAAELSVKDGEDWSNGIRIEMVP